MAKKLSAMLLAMLMVFSCVCAYASNEKKTYTAAEVTETGTELKREGEYFTVEEKQGWFGIKGVDLTGVKSIGITGKNPMTGWTNAETFRVKIDNPMNESIGFVSFNAWDDEGGDVTCRGNISEVSGKHDLYFATTLTRTHYNWQIKEITLYTDSVVRETVSDDKIIDNWADTWTAVDDFGRKVADYEEAGPVKDGEHTVAMMYWIWNAEDNANKNYNIVIPDVIRKDPAAKTDSYSDSWMVHTSKMYWGEPIMGFYTSQDFWVYKKHAVLLADAGVDVIFFDFTNSSQTMTKNLITLAEAFLEAKSEGVNVPKICDFGNMMAANNYAFDELTTLWYNIIQDERYADLWFEWEGKPFAVSWPTMSTNAQYLNTSDKDVYKIRETIDSSMELRQHKTGAASEDHNDMSWIDEYPQQLRGKIRDDGRVESITLAMAVNRSTIYGISETGVFSDQYSMDKAYSKAFGEDYTERGVRKGYFLREMEGLILEIDPTFVFVDGWNEFNTPKYSQYGRYKCAFVDLFDEAGSRDFEPSRSYIKDDYYNMLVDFVRRYKGVRPAPVASEPVTITVSGDVSQWDSVAPEFINNYTDFERDSYGYMDTATNERIHYTTTVNNAISRAKVARDANNLYFMAKTNRAIKEGGEGFMNLFINTDRNYATGWAGYDFAINKNGKGTVAKYENGAWVTVGNAEVSVADNVMQLSVARALLGVTGTVDLEFKWTDSVVTDDYLDFYDKGSVAPTGKFNYLYTEIAQVSLSESDRQALKGTSVLKAGNNKMVVSGGKMGVYEADTRITPFEANGTLYVPADTYEELLGFGLSKVRYDAEDNILFLARHDLDISLEDPEDRYADIVNYVWTYNVLGSAEVRVNGELRYLSAPLTVVDGIIYVPLTYAAEAFDMSYRSLGNGAYAISYETISDSAVSAALGIMG